MSGSVCEACADDIYDEERDEYYCDIDLDEDEMGRVLSGNTDTCPYFDAYDEYKTVRKQN